MTSYPTSKENTLDNYTEIDKIQKFDIVTVISLPATMDHIAS